MTDFLGILENIARVISARSKVKVVREDPTDDMVFRTAYSAKADYIVSGDKHVLHIKKYRGIRDVAVREMLEMI